MDELSLIEWRFDRVYHECTKTRSSDSLALIKQLRHGNGLGIMAFEEDRKSGDEPKEE